MICPDTRRECVAGCTPMEACTPPGVARPTKQMMMMEIAGIIGHRSTCSRLQVGCIITDADFTSIYSMGYNGNYRGGPNKCDSNEVGNCGCLHAEDNALVKLRTEAKDLVLFTTHSPCPMCAKRIVNQGNIAGIWYAARYRNGGGLAILRYGGVTVSAMTFGGV